MVTNRFSTLRMPVLVLCILLIPAYFFGVKYLYSLPFSLSYFHDMRDSYAVYAPDAEYMNDHGYMKGVDSWDFAPGHAMTRAELVNLLLRLKGINTDKLRNVPAPNSRFTDLDQKAWYPTIVTKADQLHLLPFDIKNNQFDPSAPVTRAEVAQAVADIFNLQATSAPVNATDIAGNPHEDAIKSLLQHSYANGTQSGLFQPNQQANRAMVARIFHLALVDNKGKVPQGGTY